MTLEEEKEKKLDLEELMFKKRWAKYLKLSPIVKNLRSDVGRAHKCGVREKPINIAVDTKVGNKKKK